MAKKNKVGMNAELFEAPATQEITATAATVDVAAEDTADTSLSQIENNYSLLLKENEELKERINDYIIEVEKLRDFDKKLAEAKKLNEQLQEENDKYLMKISDLTFEVAKMTASVDALKRNAPAVKQQLQPPPPVNTKKPRPVNYINKPNAKYDGYSDWN